MGFPQEKFDPEKPRIAYWKCNEVVTFWGKVYFKGCDRLLCDPHCRKYTEFKRGKRDNLVVKREYLKYRTCWDCKPKLEKALVDELVRQKWCYCSFIIIGVVILITVVIIALATR